MPPLLSSFLRRDDPRHMAAHNCGGYVAAPWHMFVEADPGTCLSSSFEDRATVANETSRLLYWSLFPLHAKLAHV